MQRAEGECGMLDCGLGMYDLKNEAGPECETYQTVGALHRSLAEELEITLFSDIAESRVTDEPREYTIG